ncbi:hypothetical protein K474DRAFT_1571055, partial [Panus rudis PR-1116 ss-1]
PCTNCVAVTSTVQRLADIARYAQPHTSYKYLSHEQLRELLRDRNMTINYWKLQVSFFQYRLLFNDYSHFMMAVATDDVPRLRQLINQAQKSCTSVSKIVGLGEEAIAGNYHVRGYSEHDHAMSLLALRL